VLLSAFKTAYSRFDNFPPFVKAIITVAGIFLFCIAVGVASVIYDSVSNSYANYRANHLSPGEHLQIAHDLCHEMSGVFTCKDSDAEQAIAHVKKIPVNTPEYNDVLKLLSQIQSNQADWRQFANSKSKNELL
jgi:hypothetical protein